MEVAEKEKENSIIFLHLLAVLPVTYFMLQSFYSKLDLETEPNWQSFVCLLTV
jgi:hypothetical protein